MTSLNNDISGMLLTLMALFCTAGCATPAGLQSPHAPAKTIVPDGRSPAFYVDKNFLADQVAVLASDSLKGRGTGQTGATMTADFLSGFYRNIGISTGETELIRQQFDLEGIFWDAVSYDLYRMDGMDTLFIYRSHLEKGGSSRFFPIMDGARDHDAPVIFAGHAVFDTGDEISRSIQASLENNWAMVFEPGPDNDRTRTDIIRELTERYRALGVIFIPGEDAEVWEDRARAMSRQLERPRMIRRPDGRYRASEFNPGTAVSVHPELALGLLGLARPEQLDSVRASWHSNTSGPIPEQTGFRFRNSPVLSNRSFEEENIVFVIPGADEQLSREAIVLTAHYDHMGLGQPDDCDDIVYSGADDNASGTAVLMQLARSFRELAEDGYQPSRTLVFVHAAAEEWGLFGSRYFVDNPPFTDLEIVTNINVDMVGYVDNIYAEKDDQDYVYVIGAGMVSSLLEELVDAANNATSGLVLDERYNDTSHRLQLYRRSDHWPFAERNIPFVFFFSGLHDHYHRPSDTADRIDDRLLAARARLIGELVWYLAETPAAPQTDRKELGVSPVPSR
jgi:hypothetical protein